jgi:histone-binding protein RBBP4
MPSAHHLSRPPDKEYNVHRMLIGTHTSGNEKNLLQIAAVHLPKPNAELKEDAYDESRGGV